MPGSPVNDETRAGIVAAHGEGKSRNAIAKQFGVAGGTVTRICADAGLTFDRTQTEIAVRARSVDLAAERLLLSKKMIIAAGDLLDELGAPYLVYNFGGKENDFNSQVLDSAPVDVRRSAVVTAGIAFDKATKVLEKTNDGMGRAESLVDHLEQFFDTIPEPTHDDG